MRIAVCSAQVPFARGGTEIFVDELVQELRKRGHEAELVTVPYKWYPGTRVLTQAFMWRLLDLTEAEGRPIDLVVATKFPSYAVRHPHKVVWLLHQFRQAYELDRTELGQFAESAEDRATRRAVQAFDKRALGEARKVFATSRNNSSAWRAPPASSPRCSLTRHRNSPYRCDELRRLRPLRRPARPRQARRPPDRGRGRAALPGCGRRRARPHAAGGAGG